MTIKKVLKQIAVFATAFLVPFSAIAAGGSTVDLEKLEVRLTDERAMQSGAGIFVNYCMSCHSAEYMRYNRMAKDLGLSEDLVKQNMIFSDAKIGDPMTTTMSDDDAKEWFGVAPPDLSLVARLRGSDWLYGYLRGFYVDDASASGWNNVVFENVAMPHVMHEMQGTRRAVFKTETDSAGNEHRVFDSFDEITPGTMNSEEFDRAMSDLTHFLVYMGEPSKLGRTKIGLGVLAFLGFFGFLAYLLKKEYWRDVH